MSYYAKENYTYDPSRPVFFRPNTRKPKAWPWAVAGFVLSVADFALFAYIAPTAPVGELFVVFCLQVTSGVFCVEAIHRAIQRSK